MGLRGWLALGEGLTTRRTALRRWLPRATLLGGVLAGIALDLVCLYRFIVPLLAIR